MGTVDAGSYDIQISAFGYNTKIVTGVVLSNGILTILNVALSSGQTITFSGNISLGAGTTFNGGAFSHSVGGNWTNNGTFTGSTSTVTLAGTGANISGGGANNFNHLTVTGPGVTVLPTASSLWRILSD